MERGRKVIDDSVTEWLAELRLASEQFENFVGYAIAQGATNMWGARDMTAEFTNGWSASASLIRPMGGPAYIKCASWSYDASVNATYESVKNDWRAAVDRAVSGGAS